MRSEITKNENLIVELKKRNEVGTYVLQIYYLNKVHDYVHDCITIYIIYYTYRISCLICICHPVATSLGTSSVTLFLGLDNYVLCI